MTGIRPLAAFEFFGVTIEWINVLWAVCILVATIVVAVILRLSIIRHSRRQESTSAATWYTLSRLVMYTVLFVGIVIAVSALGLPLSQFSLLSGAIGVGLGFGLQSLFANFISGIVLLLDKSLKVGDFVELESGVIGEVRDIRMRATDIVTNDNIDILVPNSEFVNGRVVNWTHRDVMRRLRVPFGVAYGTDKELVKAAALEAAAAVPFTLALEGEQRPQVWLSEFGESSLKFELVIWLNPEATKMAAAITAAYNWELLSALKAHGIQIPFPQRDLHVKSLFGLKDEDARDALSLAEQGARPDDGSTGGRTDDDGSTGGSGTEASNDAVHAVRDAASGARGRSADTEDS